MRGDNRILTARGAGDNSKDIGAVEWCNPDVSGSLVRPARIEEDAGADPKGIEAALSRADSGWPVSPSVNDDRPTGSLAASQRLNEGRTVNLCRQANVSYPGSFMNCRVASSKPLFWWGLGR